MPLWATIVALLAVVGVAVAAVQFTYQISNTMRIAAYWTLEVWNEDHTELVTAVDWGDFALGTTIENVFWIKNVGNVNVYPSWNVTSFPSTQFEIHAYYWTSVWTEMPQDTAIFFLEPGLEMNFKWTLTCIDETLGDYGFTLNINGNDNL